MQDLAMPKKKDVPHSGSDLDIKIEGAKLEENDDDRSSSLSEPEDDENAQEELILSQLGSGRHSNKVAQSALEADSEAETERIEPTPHKSRRRTGNVENTPSKLGQHSTIDDDLSDPPSPLPIEPDGDFASGVNTTGTSR